MRRGWIAASGLAVALAVGSLGGGVAAGGRPGLAAQAGPAVRRSLPADRTARRRWALARMDEMAQERRRCQERFTTSRQIAECEAAYARSYHEYNEIYIEAARE